VHEAASLSICFITASRRSIPGLFDERAVEQAPFVSRERDSTLPTDCKSMSESSHPKSASDESSAATSAVEILQPFELSTYSVGDQDQPHGLLEDYAQSSFDSLMVEQADWDSPLYLDSEPQTCASPTIADVEVQPTEETNHHQVDSADQAMAEPAEVAVDQASTVEASLEEATSDEPSSKEVSLEMATPEVKTLEIESSEVESLEVVSPEIESSEVESSEVESMEDPTPESEPVAEQPAVEIESADSPRHEALGEPHEILASLIAPKKKAIPVDQSDSASASDRGPQQDAISQTPAEMAPQVDAAMEDSAAPVLSAKKLKKLKKLASANAANPAAKHLTVTRSAPTSASEKRLTPLRPSVVAEGHPQSHSPSVVDGDADVQRAPQKPTTKPVADDPSFDQMGLSESVLAAVRDTGYDTPTPIQAEIIPHMLAGRDLLAQSQTGTGKTAAFALPILSNIDLKSNALPVALVLAPTRELAIQVAKSFETYGQGLKRFNVAAIYGGQDYEIQFRQLRRGAHVIVGTPGRVIDHIKRGTLDLSGLQTLVLDEADEMLNMGFLEDVQFVLDQSPAQRQIALFSATLPGPVRSIAERYLNDPVKITIKKKTMTADSIRQRALFVSPREKVDCLCRFLEIEETDGVIVFTKTKDATITVAESLNREGLSAIALNGDMPQKVRERAIDQLKSGQLDVLVATDVAARGLDVKRISHVFNFDLPHDSESYIHRVGRTGRAGRAGEAIIFLTPSQRGKLRLIENATKQPIEVVQPPSADEINAVRIERFKQRITEAAANRDLTIYKELVASYAEESGKPLEMIAAALADIAQQGRPFLVRDQPKRSRRERSEDREPQKSNDRRNGRGSFEARDGFSAAGGNDKKGKPHAKKIGPPEPGMQRFRVEVGHRDGVRPGNIVGAIANEGGIGGEFIGPIKIYDSFSTIDLPDSMPRELVQTLRNTWVIGKQLRLTQFSAESGESGYSGGGGGKPGKFGGKPKFGKSKPYAAAGKRPSASGPAKPGKPKKRKSKAEKHA
jgi:ATP-dependent RNA helicase DeaD